MKKIIRGINNPYKQKTLSCIMADLLHTEYETRYIEGNLGFDPSVFNGKLFDIGCGVNFKYYSS